MSFLLLLRMGFLGNWNLFYYFILSIFVYFYLFLSFFFFLISCNFFDFFVFYDWYFDGHWLNVSFIFQYSFTLFLTLFLQYLYSIIFLLGLLFCFYIFFFFLHHWLSFGFPFFGLVMVVNSSRSILLLHLVVFHLLLVRLVFKKEKKTICVLSTQHIY